MARGFHTIDIPARPSPVRSEALENGARPVRGPLGPGGWAIAVVLFLFGAIGWLMGARYTLEGWTIGLNLFLSWLGLPVAIPRAAGWFVLICVPAGFIYSRVEVAAWQARYRKVAHFWIAWLLIVASDVGSTFLGVRYPPDTAAPLALQVAAVPGIAFAWSVVLTFLPEWLIMGAMKLLRR